MVLPIHQPWPCQETCLIPNLTAGLDLASNGEHFLNLFVFCTIIYTLSIQSMEFFQARILEWVAFPFFRGSSQPRDQTQVACIAGRFFTIWAIREVYKQKFCAKCLPVQDSCKTLQVQVSHWLTLPGVEQLDWEVGLTLGRGKGRIWGDSTYWGMMDH